MLNEIKVQNEDKLLTPALLVYPKRVRHNIKAMLQLAGGTHRLIPHIKTHKMAAVIKLQMDAGITQFKCATLAEMQLLISCEVRKILLAHQPTKEKMQQFIYWQKANPEIACSSLVDNLDSLKIYFDYQSNLKSRVANLHFYF